MTSDKETIFKNAFRRDILKAKSIIFAVILKREFSKNYENLPKLRN